MKITDSTRRAGRPRRSGGAVPARAPLTARSRRVRRLPVAAALALGTALGSGLALAPASAAPAPASAVPGPTFAPPDPEFPLPAHESGPAFAVPDPAFAAPVPGPKAKADRYLGVWNYDQPDRGTMRNIAEIGCLPAEPDCGGFIPGVPAGTPVQIPQIGRIVFTKGAGEGKVVGRTDRGCTWHFEVRRDSLELDRDHPGQSCVNRVIDSGYTLLSWSVKVSGRHETETIKGISHHGDDDYAFVLENGTRTKDRTEPWRKATWRFTGRWAYDPADPAGMTNMVTERSELPDGTPVFGRSEQRGLVDMVVRPDRTIAARTSDGCRWTLAASGNTAELAPPGQTCTRGDETVTIDFWQVASDGRRQASIMNGTVLRDETASRFLLNVGALSRR